MNGTQRSTLVSPLRIHCMYIGMTKGTPWAEAKMNIEKIKPVALTIVELHESDGIRQAVENVVKYVFFFNFVATF